MFGSDNEYKFSEGLKTNPKLLLDMRPCKEEEIVWASMLHIGRPVEQQMTEWNESKNK